VFFEEARSASSVVSSDQSEVEDDVNISCSHSEISDVNEQDGEEDIFGFLYRQVPNKESSEQTKPKLLDQTTGKVRSPTEDHDDSRSEEAEEQSIFPEPTDKDLSNSNDSCQQSSVMEPNIVFYPQRGNLSKVLDDLNLTEDSGSSTKPGPATLLTKVDSDCREEVLFVPKQKPQFKSPKVIKTLLGKRERSDKDV
jgi:hypothetical protein